MRLPRASSRRLLAIAVLALVAAAAAPARAAAACPPSSYYSRLVAGTPGLVGYWRLGETSGSSACDVTGTNGGTYSGSVLLGRSGALSGDPDTAVRFTGNGQVTAPSSNALDLNGPLTLEAWVKPETLPSSGFPGVLRKGAAEVAGASGGWLLYYDAASRRLSFKRQNVEESISEWAVGPVGTWSDVAVTYDGATGNTLRFYLNGMLMGSATGPAGGYGALNSTDPLQIGPGDQGSAHTVDEPAIYAVALSSGTILQHYQAGHGGGSGTPPGSPSHLSALGSNGGVQRASGSTSSADVASYRVYRRNPDGTWPAQAPLAGPPSKTAHTDG